MKPATSSFLKILSIFALLLSTANPAFAAKTYKVHSVNGKAHLVKNATPKLLKENMTVSENDQLEINPNSEVILHETNNKSKVFRLRGDSKRIRVSELIKKASEDEKGKINYINGIIKKNISVNKHNPGGFTTTGAAHVTTNANGSRTELNWLLGPDETDPPTRRPVRIKKVNDGNRLYHFSFRNDSDDLLYANMILKDTSKEKLDLLLPENVLLPASGVTNLEATQFIIPDKGFAGYILVLSKQPFSLSDIINELDTATQNPEADYIYEVIR